MVRVAVAQGRHTGLPLRTDFLGSAIPIPKG